MNEKKIGFKEFLGLKFMCEKMFCKINLLNKFSGAENFFGLKKLFGSKKLYGCGLVGVGDV